MRVAVSGASGLIGRALVAALGESHEVVRLVRTPAASTLERRWDPQRGFVEGLGLSDIDAVINLSGAGLADSRWTSARRRELLLSRTEATRTLAHLISLEERPSVFLSASAVGFYGSTGAAEITEDAPNGSGFLADLVRQWEAATAEAGVRTVHLRTGLVLDRSGGFLGRQLPLFRLGLGGPMGPGTQWVPWITLTDHVRAVEHLMTSDIAGPVNLSAPHPVTNATFTTTLGEELDRPVKIPVPLTPLRLAFGAALVEETLLASNRMLPGVLTGAGFQWEQPELEGALRAVLHPEVRGAAPNR